MGVRPFKTRFAPSPTGLLHLGNIRTALFNFLLAQQAGGTFLLRLEDTDTARGHEKYAAALETDLRWLGLVWGEGSDAGGEHGPYAQSQRGDIYREYLALLDEKRLAYPCFCSEHELRLSRKTQLAKGKPPRYSGRCRALSRSEVEARFAKGVPSTLRFHVADGQTVEFDDKVRGRQAFNTADIGDFIIRRSDGTPAFFFCNAVDDALMGVTLVVRGEDHLTNSPRQILLLKALGLLAPDYAHIALVVDAAGAPLSKRTGSYSVQELRTAGYLPAAVNNYLARLGHTYEHNTLMNLDQLAAHFSIDRLHKAPARYDEAQLHHWQHETVRHAANDELWTWVGEEVHKSVPREKQDKFIDTIRPNISFPRDAKMWAQIFFSDDFKLTGNAKEMVEYAPRGYFRGTLDEFKKRPDDPAIFGRDVPVPEGHRRAMAFQLLRAALTDRPDGPEFVRIHGLMPRERIERRLRNAVELSEQKK